MTRTGTLLRPVPYTCSNKLNFDMVALWNLPKLFKFTENKFYLVCKDWIIQLKQVSVYGYTYTGIYFLRLSPRESCT